MRHANAVIGFHIIFTVLNSNKMSNEWESGGNESVNVLLRIDTVENNITELQTSIGEQNQTLEALFDANTLTNELNATRAQELNEGIRQRDQVINDQGVIISSLVEKNKMLEDQVKELFQLVQVTIPAQVQQLLETAIRTNHPNDTPSPGFGSADLYQDQFPFR